jgi:hypothetical protein
VVKSSDTIRSCVDHVLQSGAFGNAPSSRRLLKYLADQSISGAAEQLKEYTIGVEAFGKSPDYDPRHDSTVRIQIGRLRQKLAEYYRDEGREDAFTVELPKGRFSLVCEPRAEEVAPAPVVEEPPEPETVPVRNPWRVAALIAGALCLAAIAVAVWALAERPAPRAADSWPPEMSELWAPFLNSAKPLLIAVGNPLFVQFENKAIYRDLSIESADELMKSPQLSALSKALGSHESRPIHYYAAAGDVNAAFLLGQRLGPRQPSMSIVRSSQLQWQQLADANVLFLGPGRFFGEKLGGLPVSLEITEGADGFQVVHPRPGEQAFYRYREPAGFFNEDGEASVLITHAAGPAGNTDVITFACNSTFGRAGAIAAFTDAGFAKMLVGKMRGPDGRIPRYFQVLLRVKYKGGVPTETSYLLHREIRVRK